MTAAAEGAGKQEQQAVGKRRTQRTAATRWGARHANAQQGQWQGDQRSDAPGKQLSQLAVLWLGLHTQKPSELHVPSFLHVIVASQYVHAAQTDKHGADREHEAEASAGTGEAARGHAESG